LDVKWDPGGPPLPFTLSWSRRTAIGRHDGRCVTPAQGMRLSARKMQQLRLEAWPPRRKVSVHLPVHLDERMEQAFPDDSAPRYLLRDRDGIYGAEFRRRVKSMGIADVVTSARSPWQNRRPPPPLRPPRGIFPRVSPPVVRGRERDQRSPKGPAASYQSSCLQPLALAGSPDPSEKTMIDARRPSHPWVAEMPGSSWPTTTGAATKKINEINQIRSPLSGISGNLSGGGDNGRPRKSQRDVFPRSLRVRRIRARSAASRPAIPFRRARYADCSFPDSCGARHS
jgi:hypothetical protein